MPRSARCFLPNHVWHLTHRCHKREFLLRFSRDRDRWCYWLFEARKRFGLRVLNFTVTRNHIHLLVLARGTTEIGQAMQLVAGRTGQEYNRRKDRHGAFWQDRYHATAVQTGEHLARCLVYIDLNMVRAGVVSHPAAWRHGGYHELRQPRQRYRIIDHEALMYAFELNSLESLRRLHDECLREALAQPPRREPAWTDSIAVGSESFCEQVKASLMALHPTGIRDKPSDLPDNEVWLWGSDPSN